MRIDRGRGGDGYWYSCRVACIICPKYFQRRRNAIVIKVKSQASKNWSSKETRRDGLKLKFPLFQRPVADSDQDWDIWQHWHGAQWGGGGADTDHQRGDHHHGHVRVINNFVNRPCTTKMRISFCSAPSWMQQWSIKSMKHKIADAVSMIYLHVCRIMDKPISFEISLGNAGNSLDVQTQASATQNEDGM